MRDFTEPRSAQRNESSEVDMENSHGGSQLSYLNVVNQGKPTWWLMNPFLGWFVACCIPSYTYQAVGFATLQRSKGGFSQDGEKTTGQLGSIIPIGMSPNLGIRKCLPERPYVLPFFEAFNRRCSLWTNPKRPGDPGSPPQLSLSFWTSCRNSSPGTPCRPEVYHVTSSLGFV